MRAKIRVVRTLKQSRQLRRVERYGQYRWQRERAQAIRLAAGGNYSLAEIGKIVGRSRATVIRWVSWFRIGGVDVLLKESEKGHRQASLNASQLVQIQQGLSEGRWNRAKEIQRWLKEQHQIRMGIKGVYYWLGKCAGVLRVPRKAHVKKNEAEVQAFKTQLAQKLSKLQLQRGKSVCIWVADEHRYGLLPVIRRCWTLKGKRPIAPYRTKYQWGYLHSALEVDGENRSEALFTPEIDTEISLIFLKQIRDRQPDAQHIVIWDGAGFHPCPEDARLPEGVHLLPLPAYAPELNPVEKIGDLFKDAIANKIYSTLREIENAIEEELRPIWQSAERVRQLIGESYLLTQANASDD